MNQQMFILIGRSGCGKGTQGKLIEEYLRKNDPSREVFYLQTGAEIREFIKGPKLTQRLSKAIYDRGGLQPEFLATHKCSHLLSMNFKENQHLIIDGTPRKFHEAGVLHSILGFYGLKKPHVIYLNVSADWAVEHLMKRKRFDDTIEDIKARLTWFETDVMPAIEFYRTHPDYRFMEINGERSIEEIHADILKKLS